MAAAAWALSQLRPNLRQSALLQAARILVLVTAGASAEPWPDDDRDPAAPPAAAPEASP